MIILTLQILLKKNKYETDGTDFEDKIDKIDKKIPDVTNLVKKQILIPNALTVVENKIPDVRSLVKKNRF